MSESTLRGRVVKMLRPWHAVSVENSAFPGTPDVNYAEGWIELKWRRRWPVNEETIVEVDHYTPQQRVWSKLRWKAGGAMFLLLQVGQEYLLFTGDVAPEVVGRATRQELYDAAAKHWRRGLDRTKLMGAIVEIQGER